MPPDDTTTTAATADDARLGECPLCQAPNSYLNAICEQCGERLPWGVAVAARPAVATQPTPATPLLDPELPLAEHPFLRHLDNCPTWFLVLIAAVLPLLGFPLVALLAWHDRPRAWPCLAAAIVGAAVSYYASQTLGIGLQ